MPGVPHTHNDLLDVRGTITSQCDGDLVLGSSEGFRQRAAEKSFLKRVRQVCETENFGTENISGKRFLNFDIRRRTAFPIRPLSPNSLGIGSLQRSLN